MFLISMQTFCFYKRFRKVYKTLKMSDEDSSESTDSGLSMDMKLFDHSQLIKMMKNVDLNHIHSGANNGENNGQASLDDPQSSKTLDLSISAEPVDDNIILQWRLNHSADILWIREFDVLVRRGRAKNLNHSSWTQLGKIVNSCNSIRYECRICPFEKGSAYSIAIRAVYPTGERGPHALFSVKSF